MKLRTIAIATGLMVAGPVVAHDFWLQPTQFVTAMPGTVPMLMYVGHGAARERWGGNTDRVVSFRSTGPEGVADRKMNLTLQAPQFDAQIRFAKPGAYVLAFQSKPSFSDLPFDRFDDYVATEGLTPIARHRERTGTQKANGRETYSRRAKAIVQVGPVSKGDAARLTSPVGLSLEIVPEQHPLLLKLGKPLSIRVFSDGKPLPGALVKLNNLDADAAPIKMVRTDRTGRAAFAIPKGGQWQFNVIWAAVTPGNPDADYETTFSSLTFAS